MRVLVVEDSKIVRERLVAMIGETEGVSVVGQAQDASEAIASVRRLRPDSVILDIQMPGGSGIEFLQSVKEEMPATMVIMLTNYSLPQYREKCANAGADFFFDKSTEFSRVPVLLKAMIAAAREQSRRTV